MEPASEDLKDVQARVNRLVAKSRVPALLEAEALLKARLGPAAGQREPKDGSREALPCRLRGSGYAELGKCWVSRF